MANKRNRLRDSFTIRSTTTTKAANGDLTETIDGQTTFRCYALHRESVLIDRTYEVPQIEFDYVLEVRSETLTAAGLVKASRLTMSKTGSTVFQVVQTLNDTLRKGRIFISATS